MTEGVFFEFMGRMHFEFPTPPHNPWQMHPYNHENYWMDFRLAENGHHPGHAWDHSENTRFSGMIHSVVLLFILVGLGPFAGWIPMCVLAAILMVTAVSMLDTYSLSLS